ncbi:helix-turn-helix domain-containing protein [Plantactinospora sp. DSM 117369]
MSSSRLTTLLGTTLRRQRELHGLTQRDLAERSGASQAAIARIEQGVRAPTVAMLERLLAALDLQLTVGVEPLDAQRWNPRWEEFGYLPTDPREPGEHRWQVVGGVLRASMADELPEAIEVRHDDRSYRVVPLALVEVTEPATADLMRRWRARHACSAG